MCAGDRDQALRLHPQGCRACAWLASNWGEAHRVLNLLAELRPSKFAVDTSDQARAREAVG